MEQKFRVLWGEQRPRTYREFSEYLNWSQKLTPPDGRSQWHGYTVETYARKFNLKVYKDSKPPVEDIFIVGDDGKYTAISRNWVAPTGLL